MHIAKHAKLLLTLSVAFASASACSSDDDSKGGAGGNAGSTQSAECAAIMSACMPKDDGSAGVVHDCHLLAHDQKRASECAAKKKNCVDACNAAPLPDAGMSGGMGGMGGMGGS